MKIGDAVIYRDVDGTAFNAVVVCVGGSGPSNGKRLDLRVPDLGHAFLDVLHAKDASDGEACWSLGAPVEAPTEITPAVIAALADESTEPADDLDIPSSAWVDLPDA